MPQVTKVIFPVGDGNSIPRSIRTPVVVTKVIFPVGDGNVSIVA